MSPENKIKNRNKNKNDYAHGMFYIKICLKVLIEIA